MSLILIDDHPSGYGISALAGEKSSLRSLIERVLLRAKIVRRSFQDVPQRPGRERNPKTQHLRKYSVDLSKLTDGSSSHPECQARNGEQYPRQSM